MTAVNLEGAERSGITTSQDFPKAVGRFNHAGDTGWTEEVDRL